MPTLEQQFALDRCPHCSVHKPHLAHHWNAGPIGDYAGNNSRYWRLYRCMTCGGFVTAWSHQEKGEANAWYPASRTLDPSVPKEVSHYLQQAIDTLHAPDGSIMLAASAIDAMLKLKGNENGTLNQRIDEAAEKNLITKDMALWAHDVRLDANAPRHADQTVGPPTPDDAKRVLNFAETLAEILFVLPERVKRGRKDAESRPIPPPSSKPNPPL